MPSPFFALPRRLVVAAFFFAAVFPALHAHLLNMTRLSATVAGDEVELRVEADLAALLGGPAAYAALIQSAPSRHADQVPALAAEILQELRVEFTPAAAGWRLLDWRFPDLRTDQFDDPGLAAMTTLRWRASLPSAPADHVLIIRTLPAARLEFPLAYSLVTPATATSLTRWLEFSGVASRPLAIPATAFAPVPLAAAAPAPLPIAETAPPAATPAPATPPAAPAPAVVYRDSAGFFETSAQYLRLGFHHILPLGLDHILFVLGLYFLGAGWRALAAQITTFTLAHTTTLGLAAYGVLNLPPAVVEPLIALSIAFVALENILRPRLGPGRLALVFAFGLLHGLGFAGSLAEIALPRDQFLTALLAFNLGVDFGQLAVLAAAFLAVGWFRARTWYRPAITLPCCAVIAAIGLYWTVERTFA